MIELQNLCNQLSVNYDEVRGRSNTIIILGKVIALDLSGLCIVEIPDNLFTELPHLETLMLANNRIQNLPQNVFANLEELLEIQLQDNALESLPDDLFSNNSKLEKIFLHGNKIRNLRKSFLLNVPGLTHLTLCKNEIEDIDPDTFSNVTNLNLISFCLKKMPLPKIKYSKLRGFYIKSTNFEILAKGFFQPHEFGLSDSDVEHMTSNGCVYSNAKAAVIKIQDYM